MVNDVESATIHVFGPAEATEGHITPYDEPGKACAIENLLRLLYGHSMSFGKIGDAFIPYLRWCQHTLSHNPCTLNKVL